MKKLNKKGKKLAMSIVLTIGAVYGSVTGISSHTSKYESLSPDVNLIATDINVGTKINQSNNDFNKSKYNCNVLYEINSVTHEVDNTITLYASHSDGAGYYFTYAPTSVDDEWMTGYWYVSNSVLTAGNVDYDGLKHNSVINGIYMKETDTFILSAKY